MPVNPLIFREYDIRGNAADDLHPEALALLIRGVFRYFELHNQREFLLGQDCRLSSPRISQTILALAKEHGLAVTNLGLVTSPAFYFAAKHLGLSAGLMVTASHNPPPDNGLKILLGSSTIYGNEIQKIRLLCETPHLDEVAATSSEQLLPAVQREYNIADTYISTLIQKLPLGPRRLKVVVDCGNGSAGPLTGAFLDLTDLEYVPLYFTPDGTFPNHEPDPVKPKNLATLRARVLAEKADFGVAFDGDGDRIGVVDDLGNFVWGDRLMIIFWREILPKYQGTLCLVEVKCSQALVDEIIRLGGRPEFCKTGHSLIKAQMREKGAVFTGEMSGHIFFADEYYGFDDALYALGRLLRIMSNSPDSLSKMLADVPQYHTTAEVRIPCPDTEKFNVVDRLRQHFEREYPVITVDGVRILFPSGWGLFRASNTGPIIVTRCEAKTAPELKHYTQILSEIYAKFNAGVEIPWEDQ
ncbi:MAG: Phosphomannomutase/phosphoglucomutase [Firmicutes bacterium]|nr:Phosphomannomutase/phosphoglucomutase [Bacillota bacterium]